MNVNRVTVIWKGGSKIVPPYGLLEYDRELDMLEVEAVRFKQMNPEGIVEIKPMNHALFDSEQED